MQVDAKQTLLVDLQGATKTVQINCVICNVVHKANKCCEVYAATKLRKYNNFCTQQSSR